MSNIRGGAQPGYATPINSIPPQYLKVFQGTAAAVGTSDYLPAVRGHIRFSTFTSGAETIKVQCSKDNTTFYDYLPIDETTGNRAASVQLTTAGPKYWRVPIKEAGQWRFWKFTKSAAVNQCFVAIACPVQELVGADVLT